VNQSLTLDGKTYISSRRASELTKYSNDYIGQLCREEKISAKRIGRTWFIQEESLLNYKKSSDEQIKVQHQELGEQISRGLKQDIHGYFHELKPIVSSGLIYSADDRPLLPSLGNKKDINSKASRMSEPELTAEEYPRAEELLKFKPSKDPIDRDLFVSKASRYIHAANVIGTIVLIVGTIHFGSAYLKNTVGNNLGLNLPVNVAAVGDWAAKPFIALGNDADHILNASIFDGIGQTFQTLTSRFRTTVLAWFGFSSRPTVKVIPPTNDIRPTPSVLATYPVITHSSDTSNEKDTSYDPSLFTPKVIPTQTSSNTNALTTTIIHEPITYQNQTVQVTSVDPNLLLRITQIENNLLAFRSLQTLQNDYFGGRFGQSSGGGFSGGDLSASAGVFSSNVSVGGTLSVTGASSFSSAITDSTLSTSTFSGPLSVSVLEVTGTGAGATSTFASGINITGGCISINGGCLGAGGSSGSVNNATAGQFAYYAGNGNSVDGQNILNLSGSNIGIGTTSPTRALTVVGTLSATNFLATSTIATSTFEGFLSAARITSTGNATNTAAQGWNITSGCFAVNGVCVGTSGAGTGTVTSVAASGGTTGLSFTGGPITDNGTLTLTGTLNVANGGTGSTTLSGILKGNGTSGVQTAVGGTDYEFPLTFSTGLTRTGNTITSNLAYDFNQQTNYGVQTLTPTTTIPLWIKDRFFASSSAVVAGNITASNFTATNTSATSTFGHIQAVNQILTGQLTVQGTGTSTFAGGVNVAVGCFSVNGSCVAIINATSPTSIPYASTTVLSVSGTTYLNTSLNGPLQANAGVVSATTSIGVIYGGTGSTTLSGILKGNGTSGVQTAVGGTDYEFPLTFSTGLNRSGNTITNTLNVDFNKQTNYGALALTPTSTIPLWIKDQVFASSSAIFAGNVSAYNFNATNTSATSTFGHIQAVNQILTGQLTVQGTGTSTFARGIDLGGGCFSINGVCVGSGSGSGTVSSALAGQFAFYNSDGTTVSGTSTLFVSQNTNIGISTTSPYAKFSIHALNGGINTTLFAIASSTQTSTSSLLVFTNRGFLGLGTSSPYATLSVVGAGGVVAESFNATNTSATSTLQGGLAVGGGLLNYDFATGITSANALQIVGGMSFETNAGLVSWADLPIDSSAPVNTVEAYTAQLNSNPVLTIFGKANGSGSIIGTSTAVGIGTTTPFAKLSVAGNGTGTGWAFAVSDVASSTKFVILDNGNVGIGTSSPGTVFSIGSTVSIESSGTTTFVGKGINLANGGCYAVNGTCSGTVTSSTQGFNAFYDATGGTISGTSTLFIARNTNIGIGTTSPFSQFSIHALNGGVNTKLFTIASSTQNSTTTLLTFTNRGFLGLGTSSPYATLSVVGAGGVVAESFNATNTSATSTFAGGLTVGGGLLNYDFYSGVTQASSLQVGGAFSFDTNAGIVSWADLPIDSTAAVNTVESYSAQLNSNPILTIFGKSDGLGNIIGTTTAVGIGTTSPYAKLSVAGNGTSTGAAFIITDIASTTRFIVLDNGFVGIGTTTPSSRLSLQAPSGNTSNLLMIATSSSGSPAWVIDSTGLLIGNTPGATSTITGNLFVNGTLRSTNSYVGDLIFGNNFRILEEPDTASRQGVIWQNQRSENVFTLDEYGNVKLGADNYANSSSTAASLTVTGDVCINSQCLSQSLASLGSQINALANATTSTSYNSSQIALLAKAIQDINVRVDAFATTTEELKAALAEATSTLASISSSVASSTASTLSGSTDFIQSIATAVQNIIQNSGKWLVDKLSAKVVYSDRIETQTAAISKGLEITDQMTGTVYCVTIVNGDWSKIPGACSTATDSNSLGTSTVTSNTIITTTTVNNSNNNSNTNTLNGTSTFISSNISTSTQNSANTATSTITATSNLSTTTTPNSNTNVNNTNVSSTTSVNNTSNSQTENVNAASTTIISTNITIDTASGTVNSNSPSNVSNAETVTDTSSGNTTTAATTSNP
jgi:hypothetical protein